MRLEDLILYYEDEVNKTSGQAQFIAQSTVDFLRTAKEGITSASGYSRKTVLV